MSELCHSATAMSEPPNANSEAKFKVSLTLGHVSIPRARERSGRRVDGVDGVDGVPPWMTILQTKDYRLP